MAASGYGWSILRPLEDLDESELLGLGSDECSTPNFVPKELQRKLSKKVDEPDELSSRV